MFALLLHFSSLVHTIVKTKFRFCCKNNRNGLKAKLTKGLYLFGIRLSKYGVYEGMYVSIYVCMYVSVYLSIYLSIYLSMEREVAQW